MFRFNLKIALRNILKYWNYSIINIGGLAIGLASFIFIVLYIDDEIKYDKYYEHAENIYRVNRLYNNNDVNDVGDVNATTNNDGEYWFMDLVDGDYTVRAVVQSGWAQTETVNPDEYNLSVSEGES